jgi:hypothetical protein
VDRPPVPAGHSGIRPSPAADQVRRRERADLASVRVTRGSARQHGSPSEEGEFPPFSLQSPKDERFRC